MDRNQRAGAAFARLCEVMARLRAPDGCPWDRTQTADTLRAYLLEETYETLDAIDRRDIQGQREELGDLLLQIVFQAEVAHEERQFDIADVCDGIRAKLVRRHPHVFAGEHVDEASGALSSWEAVKANERQGGSRLDGVPKTLPALLRAFRVGEKAAAIGFDWPDLDGVRAKVEEEWAELAAAEGDNVEEELGDLLFALASFARHLGVEPEAALRAATNKFGRRFRHVEERLAQENIDGRKLPIDQLERLWQDAKSLDPDHGR